MYRKHKHNKLNGDGPPKYKPPPPKKTNNSAGRLVNSGPVPVSEDRPLQNQYYSTQTPEPVTDLDAYQDDDENDVVGVEEREHYYSAAPSGWDDPANSEVPPPYVDSDPQDYHPGHNVNRGESFVSPAMFV